MLPPILQQVKAKGYKVFEGKTSDGKQLDYDLNIVAVRSAGTSVTNKYDDILAVVYKLRGAWQAHYFPITTDPGKYYMETASEDFGVSGTAILVPGQYRGAYTVGNHGPTKYQALVQSSGPVKVYRDSNRDLIYDDVNVEEGYFGINIHACSQMPYHENKTGGSVGKWSGGCQVFADTRDFRLFMHLCHMQTTCTGWSNFTYTLIEEEK